jgi:hypothetical protein
VTNTIEDIPRSYLAAILDMRGRATFSLNIPEAEDRSPTAEANVRFSFGDNASLAGLVDEFFKDIGVNHRTREDSSIRIEVRRNEDIQTIYEEIGSHSVEIARALGYITNHQFTKEDIVKDAESVVEFTKTVQEIRPAKREFDSLVYSPREVAQRLGVSQIGIESHELPRMPDWDVLPKEYMGGVFDSIGGYHLQSTKDSTFDLGYSLRPRITLHRSSLHPVTVALVQDTLTESGVPHNVSTQSNIYTVQVEIHGENRIQKFHDAFGDEVFTSFPTLHAVSTEILPRFEDGLHKTKQGYYDILYLAEYELGLFDRDIKYDTQYFAEKWGDEIDTYEVTTADGI